MSLRQIKPNKVNPLSSIKMLFTSKTIYSPRDVYLMGLKYQFIFLYLHFINLHDIPPARYAEYGVVVDVIAPSIENGIQFGVQGYGTFSTGYAYGYSYLNINKGRHQLRGSYNIHHRAYEDRQTEREYVFDLNGERRHINQAIQDKFGYTTHYPSLRYTYHEGKRQTLQITFKPEINKYYDNGHANILYTRGSREDQRKVDLREREANP